MYACCAIEATYTCKYYTELMIARFHSLLLEKCIGHKTNQMYAIYINGLQNVMAKSEVCIYVNKGELNECCMQKQVSEHLLNGP